jgi:hypothetical protein
MNTTPLLRSTEIAVVTVASVDVGRSAVASQLELSGVTVNSDTVGRKEDNFMGVLTLSHQPEQANNLSQDLNLTTTTEASEQNSGRQQYLRAEQPTVIVQDNGYPNDSPLLASN